MKKIFIGLMAAVAALTGCSKAEQQPAAEQQGVDHADWSRNAVIYEVNLRQYTDSGTMKAFEAQLPRLKELGVDILWFMPIHPISQLNRKGELGSYYAVQDYKAVNPEFGTFDDFKALVDAAHALDMKVIIDWVPNHTGCDNVWVAEHPDWYARNEQGEMYGPYDWTDVYQLDYTNPEMRAAMIDALEFWVREADIDGYRCDVAGRVPVDFWNDARKALEGVKKPVFMLAEDADPANELTVEAFDMDYNWPQKDLFSAIAATMGQYSFVGDNETEPRKFDEKHAADLDELIAYQDSVYPADSYRMNMITNHDLNSWEGTEFERLGNLQGAFAVLTYTLPGMPLIYTGQETGLNRALKFFEKDDAPTWEPRNEYFTFYQKLNDLKHKRSELAAGEAGGKLVRYPTASPDLYVFARTADNSTTLVGVNLGAEDLAVEFTSEAPSIEGATDWMTGEAVEAIPAVLAPGAYFIYTSGN